MKTTNRPRPGLSLVEVLIAIMVLSIGLLCVMTLFTLGGVKIGHMLQESRCAFTAQDADPIMRGYWRHEVLTTNLKRKDVPLIQAMDDPNKEFPPEFEKAPRILFGQRPAADYPKAKPEEDGYPVMVDPMGVFGRAGSNGGQWWVAGETAPPGLAVVPRRNLTLMVNRDNFHQQCFETFVFKDELKFDTAGSPMMVGNQPVRGARYSWAAVIHRSANSVAGTAMFKVMVFDGRPPLLAMPLDEVVLTGSKVVRWVEGERHAVIVVPARGADQAPLIRKGGWVMDGTIDNTLTPPIRRAEFYRVVAVIEGATTPAGTEFTVDLDRAIEGPQSTMSALYLFAGLAEIFDRPVLKK